jgi:Spy/CpxP family protein refolding chaperone
MKKIIFIAVCALFALASQAQTNPDEVAYLQSTYGMDKRELVADHMKITKAESAAFWKVYDKYEAARQKIGKKRINNINEYAKNYSSLSDAKATELVNKSLEINAAFTNLQKSTFKEMAKAVSPVRAAQFIQIELFIENILRTEIADEIPLIGEFDVKKK